MRKNRKPGESPASTDVSQAPSEPARSVLDTSVLDTSVLDTSMQSTASSLRPVGRGALLAGTLASRPGSSSSMASSQAPAVGRQALLERLKIKSAEDTSVCTPKPAVGRAALVRFIVIVKPIFYTEVTDDLRWQV